MSEANHTPQQSYISRVRLKGYKSIVDTEVELKPGLNIIIGPNGSGKTNFVEYVASIFDWDYASLRFKFDFEIEFYINKESFSFHAKSEHTPKFLRNNSNIPAYYIEEKGKSPLEVEEYFVDYFISIYDEKVPVEFYKKNKEYLSVLSLLKFSFSIPDLIEGLNDDFSVSIWKTDRRPVSLTFSKSRFVNKLFYESFLSKKSLELLKTASNIDRELVELLIEIPSNIKKLLARFTNIKDIRLNNKYNIFEKSETSIGIDSLNLEFFVQENWLPWTQLSDGTKRLFLIITDILSTENGFFLLEEPELGIHPHQLSRLMDFIKEQSESKQIILTTHSPQVLNILDPDDLDRIIISRYDKEKGTQLYHLTEEEIRHARSYMEAEGLFLSDFWVYSGFEQEEEQV